MMLTLFVGGPWDGRREELKDSPPKEIRCVEAPSSFSWAAGDTLKYGATPSCREHRYDIHRISLRLAVAVHQSLEGKHPLDLIFDRYPHPTGQKVY